MQTLFAYLKFSGLYAVAWGLGLLPFRLLWGICQALGLGYYGLASKRRRMILSNWHHAFPEKPQTWIAAQARRSCMHLVELGLMGVVWPFWSEATLRKRFTISSGSRELFQDILVKPQPRLILVPHFSLTESLTLVPWLLGQSENLKIGVLYRPLNQLSLDAFVKKTRERGGLRLIPRSREGIKEALAFLEQGNSLVILFDQSPRQDGWLGPFMGRLATTTALPGRLLERYQALAYICYPRALGPFKAEICLEQLEASTAPELIARSNAWLGDLLKNNPTQAQTWLWAHNRWRFLEQEQLCLGFPSKIQKLPLPADLKGFRLWVILPSSPEVCRALVPMLEALQRARPDMDLELYVLEGQEFKWPCSVRVFPRKLSKQKDFFKKQSTRYPDALLVCPAEGPLDHAVALTHAPLRLGYAYCGDPRPGLTHLWQAPPDGCPKDPLFWKSLHAAFSPR